MIIVAAESGLECEEENNNSDDDYEDKLPRNHPETKTRVDILTRRICESEISRVVAK